jgi:hypothetical protein
VQSVEKEFLFRVIYKDHSWKKGNANMNMSMTTPMREFDQL